MFALGRPGTVDAETVNYAENEQICRYLNGRNAQRRWIPDEEPEQGSGCDFGLF